MIVIVCGRAAGVNVLLGVPELAGVLNGGSDNGACGATLPAAGVFGTVAAPVALCDEVVMVGKVAGVPQRGADRWEGSMGETVEVLIGVP